MKSGAGKSGTGVQFRALLMMSGALLGVGSAPAFAQSAPADQQGPAAAADEIVDDEAGRRDVKVSVRPECFDGTIETVDWQQRKPYDEFDFGYVLTVHKSQGSQWDDVVLFDESFAFPESRERWLYTGITRAAKRLTVVV